MALPPQSFKIWAIALTVLHVIAILSSVFRVFHRHRVGRLWLDDYVAFVAVPVDLLYLIILWMRYLYGNSQHSVDLRVSLYFLSAIPFFIIIWVSRISIALSMIRILPDQRKLGRFVYGLSMFFALVCLALILQTAAYCSTNTSWHRSSGVQCSGHVWITSLVFDIMGDLSLVGTPIVALWRLKLPRNQRRLVQTIFSASILSCLASIAAHTFVLGPDSWGPARGILILASSHIEATTCLMVSNLLAFASIFYHYNNQNEGNFGAATTIGGVTAGSMTRASYHPEDGSCTSNSPSYTDATPKSKTVSQDNSSFSKSQ